MKSMNRHNKIIQKEVWRTRLSSFKTIALALLLITLLGLAILAPRIPMGPTKEITAYVESIGVSHGGTGGSAYLICELSNGEKVRAYWENQIPLKKGEKILLLETPRLTGGKKYEFAGKSNN